MNLKLQNKHLREKPVLGICGGQQLLNVVLGGTLIQHIPDSIDSIINHEQENPRNEPSHIVKITQNTKLHDITKVDQMFVNSAHHQSVDVLGKDLIINSIANDGVIEGIENPNHKFCMGVQWHPEFLIDRKDIEIFKAFSRKLKVKLKAKIRLSKILSHSGVCSRERRKT